MPVAVVGAYGVGLTVAVDRMPGPGETITSSGTTRSHGGKGSNQAVGVVRLGIDATLLTCLGSDTAAAAALAMWRHEGVTAVAVQVAEPTMTGMIFVEPDGENRIVIVAGATDRLSTVDVDGFAECIAEADICLVSLEIPRATAIRALEVARRVGTRTVLNPAPAPRVPLSGAELGLVDVLTPNEVELRALTGGARLSVSKAIAILARRSSATIVATLGKEGARIADEAGQRVVAAATPSAVVDTTGAGDAFNAALASALAGGAGIDEAVVLANAAAAHSVGVAEVLPGLPRRSDVDRVLASQDRRAYPATVGTRPNSAPRQGI